MSDFEINEDALEREWLRQPELYHKYAVSVADKRAAMETAKSNVDILYAELYLDITNDPEKYGMAKTTEKSVEAMIKSLPQYKKALTHLNHCRHDLQVHDAAVNALDHKKKALESLVSLHLSDYYSSPKLRHKEDREALDEKIREPVRTPRRRKRVRE